MASQKGTITISIEAVIKGYQAQLKAIQDGLNKLDPGSAIAKNVTRIFDATSSKVESFGRELTRTFSSQEGLDKLNKDLDTIGNSLLKMNNALGNASWQDMTDGPVAGLRVLKQELKDAQSDAKEIKIDAFNKLYEKIPEMKQFFESLKIDPKKIGIEDITKKIDEELRKIDEAVAKTNAKISDAQTKISSYRNAMNASSSLSDYVRGSKEEIFERLGFNSFLKGAGTGNEPYDPYSYVIDSLKNNILVNLDKDKHRQGHPEVIAEIQRQLVEPIQKLREATGQDAIRIAVEKINEILRSGTADNAGRVGLGIKGTTGLGTNTWIKNLIDSYTGTGGIFESFDEIRNNIQKVIQEFNSKGMDTTELNRVLEEIAPSRTGEELKIRLEYISKIIHDGVENIGKESKKGLTEIPKLQELINNETAKLGALDTRRTYVTDSKNSLISELGPIKKQINIQEDRIKQLEEQIASYKQMIETDGGKARPLAPGALKNEQAIKNTMAQAREDLKKYGTDLENIRQKQQGLNNFQSFIQRWFSVYAAINLVRKGISSIKTSLKELDQVMTQIAIVTDLTQADLWKQMPNYTAMAKEYAVSIKGVYQVSQLWYQQGLQQNDIMALTEQTLKMARISGLEYGTATDYKQISYVA